MKRILFFAALVLGMVSCMKDQSFDADLVGDGNFVLSVALPDNATRAAGVNSAEGAIANNVLNEYDIRYTLEVYDANGNLAKEDQHTVDATSTSFELRLVPGRHYRFVVWADFVKEGVAYYNVDDLRNVTLTGTHNAMNESRDAYTAVFNTETDGDGKTFSSASKIAMTLTRPFAKLRVVTNDMDEIYTTLQSATVKYTTPIYTTFNALTETADNLASNVEKSVNFTEDAYLYAGEPKNGEQTLFADYIFGAENDVVMFTLDVTDSVETLPTISFNTNIPVQRNHLTTILGPVLTDANEVSVKIEDAFAAENIIIEGEYTLTADMEVDRPIVVLAGTEAVIDLNGFDIINTNASETFGEGEGIIAYGNLTIKGNGTVKGSTMAVWARGTNNATITIEGGNFEGCAENFAKGGRSVVYASSGNVINIYGGTFKALAADNTSYANKTEGVYAALNVADNNGMINVYGGSFYKQNPAAPGTEPAAWNATHPNGFVADGYASVAEGDWYNIYYTGGVATIHALVKTADELNAALANTEVTNILLAEGEFGTIVAKSNKTIVGTENAKVDCVNLNGANNLTLKNINFDAAKATMAYGGDNKQRFMANIFSRNQTNSKTVNGAHNLIIDGCKFTGAFANGGVVICFADQTKAGSGNITIKNCVFDTVANGTYASIYGYYFGDGNNGHDKLIIEDNIFKTNYLNNCFPAYLGKYASSTPVVVKNNVFENVSTLDNAVRLQDHSNYGVSINASNNTFAQ